MDLRNTGIRGHKLFQLVYAVLEKCYDLKGIRVLCGYLGIPPGEIIIPGQGIHDAVTNLIDYIDQRGGDHRGGLYQALNEDDPVGRPNCDEAKKLNEFILRGGDSKVVIISHTPDLLKTYQTRIKGITASISPPGKITLTSTRELIENKRRKEFATFFSGVQSDISQCTAFISIIGETLGEDIKGLNRTHFEVEYECAFFRNFATYLFIPKQKKAKTEPKLWKRINRLYELQHRYRPSDDPIFYEVDKDDVDLILRLESTFYKI